MEYKCPNSHQVNIHDRFCRTCGAELVVFEWSNEALETNKDNIFPISSSASYQIKVTNIGSVPSVLYLSREGLRNLPNWVKSESFVQALETEIVLYPAEEYSFEVFFEQKVLNELLRNNQNDPETQKKSQAQISFYSNGISAKKGITLHRQEHVSLILSREPYLSAENVLFRYIYWDSILKNDITIPMDVVNQTNRTVKVDRISIIDTENPSMDDVICFDISNEKKDLFQKMRFSAEQLFQNEDYDQITFDILPQHRKEIVFKFNHNPDIEQKLGWFSVEVEVVFDQSYTKTEPTRAKISGVVGKAPTIEVSDQSGGYYPDAYMTPKLTLKNPGHLPVQFLGHKITRQKKDDQGNVSTETMNSELDWMTFDLLNNSASEEVYIPPNSSIECELHFHPLRRPKDENDFDSGERQLEILHSGLIKESSSITITANIKKVVETADLFLAIDFGTSNSVASIGSIARQTTFPLLIEQKQDSSLMSGTKQGIARTDQLASLIYFRRYENPRGNSYDLGLEGRSRSMIEAAPQNLIRSMKTIANDNPSQVFSFMHSVRKPKRQTLIEKRDVSRLVSEYIKRLKNLAEESVPLLLPDQQDEIGLNKSNQVRLKRAIFTHPIDITDEGFQVLMNASHAAQLNLDCTTLEEFKEKYCIDESTSAVTDYIYKRYMIDGCEDESENIICFDIGGGTTDVSAVSVAVNFDDDCLEIDLKTLKGDSKFGGDNIDVLLAELLLQKTKFKTGSEFADHSVSTPDICLAMKFHSQPSFEEDYVRRAIGNSSDNELRTATKAKAVAIWKARTIFIDFAEKTKRKLSFEKNVEVGLPPDTFDPYKFTVSRNEFDAIVQREITKRTALIQSVAQRASWDHRAYEDLNTILFTGQTSRIPVLQEVILDHIKKEKSTDLNEMIPSDTFDPKACVSSGAAYWYIIQSGQEFIKYKNGIQNVLDVSIDIRKGFKGFKTIFDQGLDITKKHQITLEIRSQSVLRLYQMKEEMGHFSFDSKINQCDVFLHHGKIWAEVGGESYEFVKKD